MNQNYCYAWAFSEHGFTVSVHSSMSLHSIPSPENPSLQVHLYDSSVFFTGSVSVTCVSAISALIDSSACVPHHQSSPACMNTHRIRESFVQLPSTETRPRFTLVDVGAIESVSRESGSTFAPIWTNGVVAMSVRWALVYVGDAFINVDAL